MKNISIDIETFSDVDLSKSGVFKYAQSPNFEILLFSYSVDDSPVKCIDIACGEKLPEEILDALTDEDVTKWAYNCMFERVCLSEYVRRNYPDKFRSYSIPQDTVSDYFDPTSWRCDMIGAAYVGLPLKLADSGKVLGLDEQKMTEGKELIRYFCVPCKATKSNGGRTRNLPHHDPEKWELFKKYNIRDVEVEIAIHKRLSKYPVPEQVWREYRLDQEINDRGIRIDSALVDNAIAMDEKAQAEYMSALRRLTSLDNPNSVSQMKDWLSKNGFPVESLGKKQVAEYLETATDDIRSVLELRAQSAKSSVKKYTAMRNMACADGRARGCFAFYGSHTGRFAGRGIQLQNLKKNSLPELAIARETVRDGNYELLTMLYDSIPELLSELVRTALIPRDGYKYVIADFSSIEARVLAWLAGEQWKMDVFAKGGDIYCETAARMFKKPVTRHDPERAKGKQAELSCGYAGGVNALKAMGAIEAGMSEDELQPLVDLWRQSNPKIVSMWYEIERAAKAAILRKTTTETHGLKFECRNGMLFIHLPSGRMLSYVKPKIGINRFGFESITYEGTDGTKHWGRIETFSGRLTENVVQAISRDILCYAMQTLSSCFICAHIHDEVIVECSKDVSVDAVCDLMGRTPPWADGLVLRADGYDGIFYRKE